MRIHHKIGSGSFGSVMQCKMERGTLGTKPLETVSDSKPYAVKFLSVRNGDGDHFLSSTLRELCATPDATDEHLSFFSKLPMRNDVWFFSSSPLRRGTDSVAIVMEKFSQDCGMWFKSNTLTSGDITDFMLNMLQSVQSLHQDGIAHRDIKPTNLLIRLTTGEVVLTDFGFSSLLEGRISHMPSSDICTLDTRAPEFSLDPGKVSCVVDTASDMWSVGMTLLCAIMRVTSQPIGKIVDMAFDREKQRDFLRQRFAGTFLPLGPDPGPEPKTFRQWFARVLGATSNLETAAQSVPDVTPAQAFVLAKCLRLNPAERLSAKDLLRAVCVNMPRRSPEFRMSVQHLEQLIPSVCEREDMLTEEMAKKQASGSPLVVGMPVQTSLDGASFAAGTRAPRFQASPFSSATRDAKRVQLLKIIVLTVRHLSNSNRRVRQMDMFLTTVDLYDRLWSPASHAHLQGDFVSAMQSTLVDEDGTPLSSFLCENFGNEGDVRKLFCILCINIADVLLHFEGQSIKRLLRFMFHLPTKKIVKNFFVEDIPEDAALAFFNVCSNLLLTWTLEAVRALDFDVVRPSLLRRLQRRSVARNREFILGVCESLETQASTLLNLDTIQRRAEPLNWELATDAVKHQLFDVDF